MASSPQETFSVATTVEDPMTAEALVDALQEKSIDAFTRARGSHTSDALGMATTPGLGYYEILVPTPSLADASKLIDAELAAMEADADENAKAAEEEALSGETQIPEEK
jgi:hypothetical protein